MLYSFIACSECSTFHFQQLSRPSPYRSMPSQRQTAVSTCPSCCVFICPSLRMNFARGIVTRFCASNAPSRRNPTRTATSYAEPRTAVVCGTSVIRARSLSPGVRLRTRAGRTFAARPKSTCQTSPRVTRSTAGPLPDPSEGRDPQPPQQARRRSAAHDAPAPPCVASRPVPLASRAAEAPRTPRLSCVQLQP